jgi:membrane protein implicated in regulation of membrane protease activity
MSDYTLWWIAAGLAVIAELLTGTFYLLMLAVGLAAGAVAAHLGASFIAQLVVAAGAGGTGLVLLYLRRRQQPAPLPSASNPDLNLDIGQHVEVEHWHADGSARVHYRGAPWQARWQDGAQALPGPGRYVIHAIEGSELILGR